MALENSTLIEPVYFFQTTKGFLLSSLLLLTFWIVSKICAKFFKRFSRIFITPIRKPLLFSLGAALLSGLFIERIEIFARSSLTPKLLSNINTDLLPEGDIAESFIEIGICWAIINLGRSLLKNSNWIRDLLPGDDINEKITIITFLDRIFTLFIIVITIIVLMSTFGVPATSLGALVGGAGIGIGFGTQKISQNIFAGFMLFFTRPFAEGDWICIKNSTIEGTVENIGWYQTRIRTFSRRPLFIPNSIFATTEIENPGRMYNRRIKCLISLRHEDIAILDIITKKVRHLLLTHPDIDQKQVILVHFKEWDSSSVNMQVYCFTKTVGWEEWLDIQQAIFLQIADLIKKEGGCLAKPAITFYPSKKIEAIAQNLTSQQSKE